MVAVRLTRTCNTQKGGSSGRPFPFTDIFTRITRITIVFSVRFFQFGHMKTLYRALFAACGVSALAACTAPSATTPSANGFTLVPAPVPPTAEQFSDFLIGRYASLTNDPVLAAETFVRAAERAPEDDVLQERAIYSLLLAGDNNRAVELARNAQNHSEDYGSLTRLTLGVAALEDGQADYARTLLTTGEVSPFNRIVSRLVAAWAAYGADDYDAARTHVVEGLVGDDILDGVSLYMLAMIQMSEGDDDAAIGTFAAVWEERMRLAVAAEHYMRLLAARGDTERALLIADEFYQDVGNNPSVDRVARQLRNGETVEVKRLDAAEGAAIAVYSLASALAAETRDDVAGIYFNLALILNPDLDMARTMLGNTLDAGGRGDEALEVLQRVGTDSPFFATAQAQMAWILRRQDRDEEALRIASEALAFTDEREMRIQLGELYRSLEKYEEALELFDEVVTEDEAAGREDWLIYYARGVVHHELDNWETAEDDFLRSLEIDGSRAQVLNYLGYSWVDRGEHLEQAFEMIQQAVALQPYSGYIVDSLGWAYYRLGQYEQAVTYLEHAVELSSNDPTLNDHLGDAYWRVGRRIEARFQWRHALALGPEEDQIPLIQEKLENGLPELPVTVVAEDDETRHGQ